jgi:hypothetical protein
MRILRTYHIASRSISMIRADQPNTDAVRVALSLVANNAITAATP